MAKENVKKFMDKLAEDKNLQKRIEKAQADYKGDLTDREKSIPATVLPIAKEIGLEFTVAELKEYESENGYLGDGKNELFEDELGNVAGGVGNIGNVNVNGFINVQRTPDLQAVCGCAMYGTSPGGPRKPGELIIDDSNQISTNVQFRSTNVQSSK